MELTDILYFGIGCFTSVLIILLGNLWFLFFEKNTQFSNEPLDVVLFEVILCGFGLTAIMLWPAILGVVIFSGVCFGLGVMIYTLKQRLQ